MPARWTEPYHVTTHDGPGTSCVEFDAITAVDEAHALLQTLATG